MSNTKTKKIIERNDLDFYHVINLIDNNLNCFKNGLIKLTLSSLSFYISQDVLNELRSTGLSINLDNDFYIITISKHLDMSTHEFLSESINHLDSYGKIFKHNTWKSQVQSLCSELLKSPNIKGDFIFWNVADLNLYYSEIANYFKSFNFIFNIKEDKIYLNNSNTNFPDLQTSHSKVLTDIESFLYNIMNDPNLIFN